MPSYVMTVKLNNDYNDITTTILADDEDKAIRRTIRKFIRQYGTPATFCIEEIIADKI